MQDNQVTFNLFDFFEFPDRDKREESKSFFNVSTLKLFNAGQFETFFDDFQEKYCIWSDHINSFSSSLWLHYLLMYQHYSNCNLDLLSEAESKNRSAASKIFFDTFAEDTAVYSISYFDKLLKMLEDLFDVNPAEKRQKFFRRDDVIKKMEKRIELTELANKFKQVTLSASFIDVKTIRDNFVHNKSSSYIGFDNITSCNGISCTFSRRGLSTRKVMSDMTLLWKLYGDLCSYTNDFIKKTLLSRDVKADIHDIDENE